MDPDDGPQLVRNHGHRTRLLKRLCESRALVNVRVPELAGDFRSAVLAVDSATSRFQLDELHPERGHRAVAPGQELRIVSFVEGVEMRFQAVVERVDSDGGIAYYELAYPDEIRYHQRRQHVRVPVRMALQQKAVLRNDEREVTLRLLDLSAGGIGAHVTRGGDVAVGERWELELRLRNEPVLNTRVEIRFAQQDRVSHRQRLGAQFLDLPVAETGRLQRLVLAIQRELMRHT
ncbi:flagellar brake protein [Spiribacter halobius]|uniref:Flagellar brake protein n=1 Tax=Sediminicurvatus halobius TaxID=2182432 RepID=A0A2U2N023_9GAMM|nr:flagellar brake protein [Spiribacter halobius]PWG62319.1 hypothetical protein DEM34_12650 [Spiribacter halobius]UEX79760.1 flagellar brake protein [Spiribacter halobius]